MARHLTWCLRRTFAVTNCLSVHLGAASFQKASDYAAAKPNLAKLGRMGAPGDEPRDLEHFAEDARYGVQVATMTLTKLLGISEENAAKALEQYPMLKVLERKDIITNFQVLRESGMYKSTIKDKKFLLAYPTNTLKEKLNVIKALDMDLNDVASLFQLSVTKLKNFKLIATLDASYLPARNRIYYLAEKLECDLSRMSHVLSYTPYVLQIPSTKLLTFTEYMLETGVMPQHILTDMIVYQYSMFTIQTKFDRAKELGIEPLRPWLVRVPETWWKKAEEKFEARGGRFVKEHSTKEDLLCDIFKCDMDIVKYMFEKDPKMEKASYEKISLVATILRDEGYSIQDAMCAIVVMHHSPTTLKKRFAEWKAAGLPKGPLYIYGLRLKSFREILHKQKSWHDQAIVANPTTS